MTPRQFFAFRVARRGAGIRAAMAGEVPVTSSTPRPIRLVCCCCVPHHIMRDGIEPASHGACKLGIARFEAGEVENTL